MFFDFLQNNITFVPMNNNTTQFPIIDISYFTPSKNKDGVYVPGVIAKTTDLYKELHRFKEGYYSYVVEQCRSFDTKAELKNISYQGKLYHADSKGLKEA